MKGGSLRPCCPHAAWSCNIACALLLVLLTGCMAEQAPGLHAPKGVNAFVPLCRTMTANLRPKDFKELSAIVQQFLHKGKVVSDTGDLIHNVRHPPEDEGARYAYKTSKTIPELEAIMLGAQRDEQLHKAQLEALMKRLQETNELPSGINIENVTHCVSTGLDPRLFPYRPRVSFLLQVSKRGEFDVDSAVAKRASARHARPFSFTYLLPPPLLPLTPRLHERVLCVLSTSSGRTSSTRWSRGSGQSRRPASPVS